MDIEDKSYVGTKKALERKGKKLNIPPEDVEDLSHEIFLLILKGNVPLRSLEDFKRWALRVFGRLRVNWWRKEGHRHNRTIDEVLVDSAPALQTDPDTAYRALLLKEQRKAVKEALKHLEPEERQIWAGIERDWPPRKLAAKFGVTSGAMRQRMARIREKVRAFVHCRCELHQEPSKSTNKRPLKTSDTEDPPRKK